MRAFQERAVASREWPLEERMADGLENKTVSVKRF